MSEANAPEPTAELPTVSGLPDGAPPGPSGVELSALTASVAVPAPGEQYQVPPWLAAAPPPTRPAPPGSPAPPPVSPAPSGPTSPPPGLPARRPTPPFPVVTRPAPAPAPP